MKRWKQVQLGVLLAVTVAAALGLVGCDLEEIVVGSKSNVEAVRERTQTFELSGLPSLDVASSNGYVVVRSTQTDSVHVRAILRSRGETLAQAQERVDSLVVEMVQIGNEVELRYRSADQPLEVRNVSGVSFEVTVPMMADVEVDTSNGGITVRGIEGEFVLDTSNGAIDLEHLIGVVHADTSNGAIHARGVSGILDLETSNGAIALEECAAAVDARTSNGRIDFSGTLVGDSHQMRTSNGPITVRVPASDSITFDASTSIGSISSNLPLVGDISGRDWNATLNPPAIKTLELRTSNGSIRIDRL